MRLAQNFMLLANEYGQRISFLARKSVDRQGKPIPWYTYAAIEYLGQFDFSNMNVFEFGCGASTLWWASRSNKVVSVEHEPAWHQRMRQQAPPNADIHLAVDRREYIDYIDQTPPADIVIVDGEWRQECAVSALRGLKPNGMLIFDNADWYPHTTAWLRSKKLFQIDFNGFSPLNNYCSTTSLFLNIANGAFQHNFKSPLPVGGRRRVNDGAR